VLLPSKDHAAATIKNFQASVEVETGRKLKTLRTDHGGSSRPSISDDTAPSAVLSSSSLPRTPHNRTG
jgi:hypothetical protein